MGNGRGDKRESARARALCRNCSITANTSLHFLQHSEQGDLIPHCCCFNYQLPVSRSGSPKADGLGDFVGLLLADQLRYHFEAEVDGRAGPLWWTHICQRATPGDPRCGVWFLRNSFSRPLALLPSLPLHFLSPTLSAPLRYCRNCKRTVHLT